MQSWQADIVNTWLSLSLKPVLRHVSSLRVIRTATRFADTCVGRLAKPGNLSEVDIRSPSDNCSLKWLRRNDGEPASSRVILYLPGGAYIMRTPQLHRALVARICREADTSALLCFYRLAPEHPFPAGLEDALEAYDTLLAEGHNPSNVAVAGDSAGGGLALSLLLAIRDSGRPLPGCSVLMSPLLDATDHAPSRSRNSKTDSALPHPMRRGVNPRALYIGEHDPKDPLISPIYGSFEALPPVYILVSDSEMLLDDSLRLARKAHIYETEVRVDVWRKVPHVWVSMPFLPESVDGIKRIGEFLREKLAC